MKTTYCIGLLFGIGIALMTALLVAQTPTQAEESGSCRESVQDEFSSKFAWYSWFINPPHFLYQKDPTAWGVTLTEIVYDDNGLIRSVRGVDHDNIPLSIDISITESKKGSTPNVLGIWETLACIAATALCDVGGPETTAAMGVSNALILAATSHTETTTVDLSYDGAVQAQFREHYLAENELEASFVSFDEPDANYTMTLTAIASDSFYVEFDFAWGLFVSGTFASSDSMPSVLQDVHDALAQIPVSAQVAALDSTLAEPLWCQLEDFLALTGTDNNDMSNLQISLMQNHPNPFSPATTISFALPDEMQTNLSIYNLEGRLVKTLINGALSDGQQQIIWDGTDGSGNAVAPGVYFCCLKTGTTVMKRKMMLLR